MSVRAVGPVWALPRAAAKALEPTQEPPLAEPAAATTTTASRCKSAVAVAWSPANAPVCDCAACAPSGSGGPAFQWAEHWASALVTACREVLSQPNAEAVEPGWALNLAALWTAAARARSSWYESSSDAGAAPVPAARG